MTTADTKRLVRFDYASMFWIALIASLMFYIQIPIGGAARVVNVSLYELVVPVLLLAALLFRKIQPPSPKFVIVVLAPVILLAVHSVLYAYLSEGIDKAALIKETVRVAAFAIYVGALVVLFRNSTLRQPPLSILATFVLLSCADATYATWLERCCGRPAYQTIHASIVVGMFFLLVLGWRTRIAPRYALGIVGLGLLVVSVMLFLSSKAFVLIASAVLALALYDPIRAWVTRRDRRHVFYAFGAGIIAVATLVGVAHLAGVEDKLWGWNPGKFARSVSRSMITRENLWALAWDHMRTSFPWGIGLGQFSVVASAAPALANLKEGLRVVHNTPLSLITELGFVGVVGNLALVAILTIAARPLDAIARAMFLIYTVVPLMLHDALGLRMLHIVLALMIAESVFKEHGDVREVGIITPR